MRPIKAWHCDFCKRIMAHGSKKQMAIHEKNCLNNPDNRACKTCQNFTRNYINLSDGGNYEEAPSCREGYIKPDPGNPKNSYGLRKNCEHWKAKYPGEAE